ncbi:hypothetical protein jhhlp_002985 [Lomentospora prolificans]|uniref:RNI-like protein n=1 Tax=Lomentospora prolificans TaxID=41688 RepID=A0A2N3NFL1_9PEZI|nr:hypothetical protein jhhlp_002985 [Lomentospora prolificans]
MASTPSPGPPIIVCGSSNPALRRGSSSPSSSSSAASSGGRQNPARSEFDMSALEEQSLDSNTAEASRLARLCRMALGRLAATMPDFNPSVPYTAAEILAMPFHNPSGRAEEELLALPRRKSKRMLLAAAVAELIFPSRTGSLSPLIRYDADRVKLRGWVMVQREFDLLAASGLGRLSANGGAAPCVWVEGWARRILEQGEWDEEEEPVSLQGVKISNPTTRLVARSDLRPLMKHLERGGTHMLPTEYGGEELNGGRGEVYYRINGAEFRGGIVLEDGRLDLYKIGLGPDLVMDLLRSLRANEFIKHILLGENNIGEAGCAAIARFLKNVPNRIETWQVTGNNINSRSLKLLVDSMIESRTVMSVWLKGNPLGPESAPDLARLITGARNLRILDLDQTQLGDAGVAALFNSLTSHVESLQGGPLPLEVIYLSGNGVSVSASKAIARFLSLQSQAQPLHRLHSIYLSYNPLGNKGIKLLAEGVRSAQHIRRLALQSVGVGTEGIVTLCNALHGHPSLRTVDLSQGLATPSLGQTFNYINDDTVPALCSLLTPFGQDSPGPMLEYLSLGHCSLTEAGLQRIYELIRRHPTLCYFWATSVRAFGESDKPIRQFIPAQGPTATEFVTGAALGRDVTEVERAAWRRLEANVKTRYGEGMTYDRFRRGEKRWLVMDRGVRVVDSVYGERDLGEIREKLLEFVENDYDEDDDTDEE